MRDNLDAYRRCQVFLNYPFDCDFESMAQAMHFCVIAGGLIPVCAKDLSVPDRPRLEMLVDAISNCQYSAHDLSRFTGMGDRNLARFNMPLELGMAIFHAVTTSPLGHCYAIFVPTDHDYHAFVSDLSGLDPICYHNDETELLSRMCEWLRRVVQTGAFVDHATSEIMDRYLEFKQRLSRLRASDCLGLPTHDETQEIMYQVCAECGWWDWRGTKDGVSQFPPVPLAWRDEH